jgi:hypothetical protein
MRATPDAGRHGALNRLQPTTPSHPTRPWRSQIKERRSDLRTSRVSYRPPICPSAAQKLNWTKPNMPCTSCPVPPRLWG